MAKRKSASEPNKAKNKPAKADVKTTEETKVEFTPPELGMDFDQAIKDLEASTVLLPADREVPTVDTTGTDWLPEGVQGMEWVREGIAGFLAVVHNEVESARQSGEYYEGYRKLMQTFFRLQKLAKLHGLPVPVLSKVRKGGSPKGLFDPNVKLKVQQHSPGNRQRGVNKDIFNPAKRITVPGTNVSNDKPNSKIFRPKSRPAVTVQEDESLVHPDFQVELANSTTTEEGEIQQHIREQRMADHGDSSTIQNRNVNQVFNRRRKR